MTGRGILKQVTCVLILALTPGIGALKTVASPQMPPPAETTPGDSEEDVLDLDYVRHQAQSGKARFQTQLADHFMTARDFTNAVAWYRKAAAQGDVPAQLSLAGCLMAGRGAAKNSKEAAHWLRLAADRIEGVSETSKVAMVAAPVAARTNAAALTPQPAPALVTMPRTNPPPKLAGTNPAIPSALTITQYARPQRADALISSKPVLQEIAPQDPSPPR